MPKRVQTMSNRKPPVLERLRPKLAMLGARLTAELAAPRLRGRQAVERNRRFLAAHPYCAGINCRAAASEVDHVVPLHLGGADDVSNLQALCRACHAKKTAAEAAQRVR